MYAPLAFVEQMSNYYMFDVSDFNSLPMVRQLSASDRDTLLRQLQLDRLKTNVKSQQILTKYFDDEENKIRFLSFHSRHFPELCKNSDKSFIGTDKAFEDFRREYTKKVGLEKDIYNVESDYDFAAFLLNNLIINEWKYHKFTYRPSNFLTERLLSMTAPNEVTLKCFKRMPASTVYIDLSEVDRTLVNSNLSEDLEGMFVTVNLLKEADYLSVNVVGITRGRHGRLMPLYYNFGVRDINTDSDDTDCFLDEALLGKASDKLYSEDNVVREIYPKSIGLFILNFLLYLQASNKDVQQSEVSKKTFAKQVNKTVKPKNKFKELRIYEVGYHIVPTGYKSAGTSNNTSGTGSAKSPHYRKAHWHHFWTGSGENKKLTVKWLDGIYVNGKADQPSAAVRRVN